MTYRIVSFDIDGTLFENQDRPSKLTGIWQQIPQNERPQLCYNTGRLLSDVISLVEKKILPAPDYIISGVGTSIYDCRKNAVIKEFSAILEEGWNIDRVAEIISKLPFPFVRQPKHFQNSFKISYFLDNATPIALQQIERLFESFDVEVNIVYSGNRFLDVLPKWANKGNALKWLAKYIGCPLSQVIVGGDSGNDIAMFRLDGVKGIVVGNAQEELYRVTKMLDVYHAAARFECGIVEGLVYYNVLPASQACGTSSEPERHTDPDMLLHWDAEGSRSTDRKDIDVVVEAYGHALEAIRQNITPAGFSACSLTLNTHRGTDINYRSVWARDGSVAIIGTLPLINDRLIHECQKNTFNTLLKHISPNGQIPSNVQIDTDEPDYSGIGGICSIDSGLWLLISFYEYIKVSRDIDFLRRHIFNLQKVMDWLSAHDGNNDALLEIPEAGDWTDLFGRNYNVLYDEVLWYHANLCFGRLHEMLGNEDAAGGYIRWSQIIKREILLNFWPTTNKQLYQSLSFADQQYSLGDASYLIAQVTPFGYSWRCDVYANILAWLFDVTDAERAMATFRFMWGVGVNEPYPVVNLYPPVHPGDPDWRAYYTVNLLNLPDHYHNGGIWPFIGAEWVKFIHKLGLKELAVSELTKLAQLNKLGQNNPWEFSEWAHGKTGRPMGKICQAWSASQFIEACHKLGIIQGTMFQQT